MKSSIVICDYYMLTFVLIFFVLKDLREFAQTVDLTATLKFVDENFAYDPVNLESSGNHISDDDNDVYNPNDDDHDDNNNDDNDNDVYNSNDDDHDDNNNDDSDDDMMSTLL